MCTFTPYLFPNCHCTKIITGALELCSAATRTGEKCSEPEREILQKRPGTCCPCKQAQFAREKAKAEVEAESKATKSRAGRKDSLVGGAAGAAVANEILEVDVEPAKPASKSSADGKGRKLGRRSPSGKGAGEGKGRTLRSRSKTTTLPAR